MNRDFKLVLTLALSFGLSACQSQAPSETDVKMQNASVRADARAPARAPAPLPGKFETESCTPVLVEHQFVQSDCDEGLVCAPNQDELGVGTCRVDCGRFDAQKKSWEKEGMCPEGRTCQLLSSLSADELGAFCLPVQRQRDGACSSPSDENACSDNRLCAVTEVGKDESGETRASSYVCRDACPFGNPNAKDACLAGEICVEYEFEASLQASDEGQPVQCSEALCQAGDAKCECDAANGYKCKAYVPGLLALCQKSSGVCANPVRLASIHDFSSGGFSGETCNFINGHDHCDDSLLEGLKNPGQNICVEMDPESKDGFCFGFCYAPALDVNGDGEISKEEAAQSFDCPANYSCNKDLARKLGMAKPLKDPKNPTQLKTCNPEKCEAGKPCAAECGVGDAECLSVDLPNGKKANVCGAPYGNCEPN